MKILMYGWEFPPRISGGLGVACYAIVKELAKKNLNVTLVLPELVADIICRENFSLLSSDCPSEKILKYIPRAESKQFNQTCDELFSGVHVKRFSFGAFISPYSSFKDHSVSITNEDIEELLNGLEKNDLPEKIKNLALLSKEEFDHKKRVIIEKYGDSLFAEVLRYACIAGRLANNIAYEVIHAHDWLTILAGIEAKKRSHKPLIFHVHALEYDRSGADVDKRIFAIEKYGLEKADHIIAVSHYTKNIIVRCYKIAPEKIKVVHNGIYLPSNIPPPKSSRPKMVLFVGRLTFQKGPNYFIDIAKKILEKRTDVQFVLAGAGDLFVSLIEKVASLRIGKNVHFTGFLSPDEVKRIYRLADVYVMPSVSEPFGLSCLEAVANGIPSVITKQSGASEVLEHVLVADYWDVNDMAAKILALLNYPILKDVAISNAGQELKKLTWDRTANAIINLYNGVVANRIYKA